MREEIESRLRALARRAGWAGAPPMVVAAGLGLACVAVVVALWRWWPGSDATAGLGASAATTSAAARIGGASAKSRTASRPADAVPGHALGAGASADTTMCVHVVGAVGRPGVYVLAAGTRVAQAIEAAGGAQPDAATDAINLAAKVEDGQQVVVPTEAQVKAGDVPAIAGGAAGAAASAGPSGAGHSPAAAKVDLNSADAAAFDTLPGVGPSTAAKIVADREANGRFKTVDDLGRVAGIGPKKLETLRDLVVVR